MSMSTDSDQSRYAAQTDRFVFWGWISAILFGIVGLVFGVILITRNRIGHGIAIIIVSLLVMAAVSSALAGAGDDTSGYVVQPTTSTVTTQEPADSEFCVEYPTSPVCP
jgi:hypothetical protein